MTPALALAERIRDGGDDVLLLGGTRGLEGRLVPEAGFELVALSTPRFAGAGRLARLTRLPELALACLRAWRVLRARGADVVISVGGYASVPAVVAARFRGIPVALVEPNAMPGRANRLAARFAARVFLQFPEAETLLGRAPCSVSGAPLRRALLAKFDGATAAAAETPRRRPLRLLVFGGSQGARQINDALIAAGPELAPEDVEIFHQTGEADLERVRVAYAATSLRAEVVAFEPDMPRRYRWADLAVCRSGALTLAELTLAGLPSLLVPYPFAADDHQAANAQALARVGAARVLDESPLPGERIVEALREFTSPGGDEILVEMGRAAAKLARPGAADEIIRACAALCERREGTSR